MSTATNIDKDGWEDPKSNDEIIAEAKAFYQEDLDYEIEQRTLMQSELRFSVGLDHWTGDAFTQRTFERRPMLVIPRMDEFLNKVKNEQRQNKPSIKVSPSGANDETTQEKRVKAAHNRQGLIRAIQYDSKATDAYQTAFDYAVDIGRGFFMIKTEYVSSNTFNQKIVIERIANPLSVICDRNRKELDYSDMKRAFVIDRVARERFASEYPKATAGQWIPGAGVQDAWVTKDDLIVADYYCIRYRNRVLYGMEDGSTYFADELKDFTEDEVKDIKGNHINKRDVKEPYIKFYKMTSTEILEERDIIGKYIPIVPVVVNEKEVDGKLYIYGMIRKLKDSALLYDFWASTEAELLTLSPKAPYVAAAGQIEGYEKYWETANTKSWAVLPYKPMSNSGQAVPPPERTQFAGVPVGIVNAKMGVVEDMRAITGIHDPSLGNASHDQSGRAIIALQRSSDNATYHYIDAMAVAITHAGKIINGWLKPVYDTHRIEKILGDEGDDDTIELGGEDENGDTIELGDGEFDVVVTMGPSYTSRRQEAADSMMQFMQAVPNAVPLVYDLLVKNMDWPGAQEIADRLKRTIPPEILQENGGEQQMQQQLQQVTQQVKQYEELIPILSDHLEKAMAELQDKGNEMAKDLEIAHIKAVTDIHVAEIRAKSDKHKSMVSLIGKDKPF